MKFTITQRISCGLTIPNGKNLSIDRFTFLPDFEGEHNAKNIQVIIDTNTQEEAVNKAQNLFNDFLAKLTIIDNSKDEGMRSQLGHRLPHSRIHSLLRDPFYIGKIRWNKEVCDGKQEPLISVELFNKIQNMLTSRTTPKYRKHNFLFRGLIKCASCHNSITFEIVKAQYYLWPLQPLSRMSADNLGQRR